MSTAKLTEADLLRLLRARFTKPGNGGSGEYAFLTQVRNSAGFSSSRTFDAVVMNLWPSRGLDLHGFEIKCSRNDWLRELKDPEKAEDACALLDRFSVAASDSDVVRPGELPPTWGLYVVKSSRLVCLQEAPLLPGADLTRPIPRDFLVALLRAAGAVPRAEKEEITKAREEGREEERQRHADNTNLGFEQAKACREAIRTFEEESGIRFDGWRNLENPKRIGRAVRAVLDGTEEASRVPETIAWARDRLRSAADDLDQYLQEAE